MSKIFITGSSGFIGTALKQKLLAEGHEITTQKSSSRIEETEYFENVNLQEIDVLYHLAGKSFVPESWEHPADFIATNVLGTSRIAERCVQEKIPIVFLSSYMYGSPEYLPINEFHPIKIQNPYALSKRQGEEIIEEFGKLFGLQYNIVRLFNIYGPNQKSEFLIPFIINQIIDGKEIIVKDLSPRRDYIFVDDVVNCLALMYNEFHNEVYNLGTGKSYSVREIIDVCQQVFETNLPVLSKEQERKFEISETIANITRIKNQFGFEPKTNLKEGIEKIRNPIV